MDVSDLVEIKNNYITLNDEPIIQKYLYGGGGYINNCWEYTSKNIELGIDERTTLISKTIQRMVK